MRLPADVQLSIAVGSVHITTAEHKPGSLFTKIFAGQFDIIGGKISLIVTL
jgi:hypothetical protein